MLPATYNLPAILEQERLVKMIQQILDRVQKAHKLLCTQAELRIMPPINEQSIISSIALFNIVKVPKVIYQAMWDAGPRSRDAYEIEDAKRRGRHILKGWIEDVFPGYDIVSFCDLSNDEAYNIHPNFSWGLYVELVEGPEKATAKELGIQSSDNIDNAVKTIHWKTQRRIGYDD
jgi:hypothetical protein